MRRRLSILALIVLALNLFPLATHAQTKISGNVIKSGTLPQSALSATGSPSSSTWLKGDWSWSSIVESDVSGLTSDLAARLRLGGDIAGGTASAPVVTGVRGVPWASTAPNSGQVPIYNAASSNIGYYTPWVQVVAVSTGTNIASLSGLLTVDGVTVTDGTLVLLTGQTTGSQNGVWTAHSGAWDRPYSYYTGIGMPYGLVVFVIGGSTRSGTAWMLTSGNPNTVDTSGTVWTQTGISVSGAAGGDLTGTYPNPQIAHTPPTWSSTVTYAAGNIVYGSDGNLYRSLLGSNLNHDPTASTGVHWELYYLRFSITLNCGAGQRFAGSSTDPAGIQQAINFIANAAGAASPSTATITIQVANNPTATVSAGTSTTSFSSATNVPVGAVLLFTSGTAGNIGKTCHVTASSGSGPYTLTVAATSPETGLSSTPANGDGFSYTYYYGANTLSVNLPTIGGNVTISGSTSTVAAPAFFPSVAASGSGSTISPGTYYVGVSYTWLDASGTTRETLTGPITSQSNSGSQNLVVASFSLPSGATGANVYVSNALGGTLHKQGSMSVSGGVASAYTMTSFNSSGSSAPTSNAAPSCYPNTLMWGSASGVQIQAASNITVNGFYIYGNSNSGSLSGFCAGGLANASTPVAATSLVIGSATVVSNWGFGVLSTARSYIEASSIQVDTCGVGFEPANFAEIRAFNANAIRCTTGCTSANYSFGNYVSINVAFSTTGFSAQYSSQNRTVPSNPASGTAVPTYGNTTAANPAFGTTGNNQGYNSNT